MTTALDQRRTPGSYCKIVHEWLENFITLLSPYPKNMYFFLEGCSRWSRNHDFEKKGLSIDQF